MYHPVRRPIILEVPNVAFKELTRGVLYARVSCQIVLAIIVASLWRMGYIISTCIASLQRNWKPKRVTLLDDTLSNWCWIFT